jgi:N-acetylneuraminate synthase/N,N'-diacetyllegionaminate synthase
VEDRRRAMKCEIIAEIGINHHGDMWIAKRMIEQAKSCGADTAKFQLYDPYKLLDYTQFSAVDWAEIVRSQLTYEQIRDLRLYCDRVGIEFLASAFDLERLEWLERLEVKRHKIASRSIYDREYVKAVQRTGKPYLVSLGMVDSSKEEEVSTACRLMGRAENGQWRFTQDVDFLYCVSEYPTPLEKIRLRPTMFRGDIGISFEYDYEWHYSGFSDHTVGTTAAMVAIALGARVIEKHFTLDQSQPGPDQICSLEPLELRTLCEYRDEVERLELVC